jgi:hypothetical protein
MRTTFTVLALLAGSALALPQRTDTTSMPIEKRQSAPDGYHFIGCTSSISGFNYLTDIQLVRYINDCADICKDAAYPEPLMTFHYTVSTPSSVLSSRVGMI